MVAPRQAAGRQEPDCMTIAYIGLGSNIEDPRAQVSSAMAELDGLPATRVLGRSSLYLSAPLGPAEPPAGLELDAETMRLAGIVKLARAVRAFEPGE